jgi:hypothetical protein
MDYVVDSTGTLTTILDPQTSTCGPCTQIATEFHIQTAAGLYRIAVNVPAPRLVDYDGFVVQVSAVASPHLALELRDQSGALLFATALQRGFHPTCFEPTVHEPITVHPAGALIGRYDGLCGPTKRYAIDFRSDSTTVQIRTGQDGTISVGDSTFRLFNHDDVLILNTNCSDTAGAILGYSIVLNDQL